MSKSNTNLHTIMLPIFQNYLILTKHKGSIKTTQVIMTHINEQEEIIIDDIIATAKKRDENQKVKLLKLDRGNRTFTIACNQIYCYGEIDFNNINDLETIDNFNFLSHLNGAGIPIRSNYDYTTHSCISPYRHCLWSETWSPARIAKYAHASLNKPQRIILFKQEVR